MGEEIFTRKENYRQYRRGWKNDRWILPLFLFLRYIFIYIDFAQLRDSFDKKRGGCSDANPREICPKCSGLDRIIRTRSIKINGGLTGKLSRVHQVEARGKRTEGNYTQRTPQSQVHPCMPRPSICI